MTLSLSRILRWQCVIVLLTIGLGLAAPSPAFACTLCSCSVQASSVSFGTYDPTSSTPDDTSGTVTVNCTGVVSLFGSVDISASSGASGNMVQRTLRQGTVPLNYNLFVNPTRTIIFGNGTSGTQTISAPLNGLLFFGQTVTIYGRVPARQWVNAGTYSDTIVVTITY